MKQIKECFKCNRELPITEFYKHSMMKDGHLNKCKQCTKDDVKTHRLNNLEKLREYDRNRGNRQTREYRKEYQEKYPNKYRAHYLVSNAVRDKRLFVKNCENCGSYKYIHAHHDDYKEIYNVRWLCASCHSIWHKKNGEGKNP